METNCASDIVKESSNQMDISDMSTLQMVIYGWLLICIITYVGYELVCKFELY